MAQAQAAAQESRPTSIAGFRIAGYRRLAEVSISSDGPLAVVCGPNNVGKSSLLDALTLYSSCLSTLQGRPDRMDANRIFERAYVGVSVRDPLIKERYMAERGAEDGYEAGLQAFADALGDTMLWLPVKCGKRNIETVSTDPCLDRIGPALHRSNQAGADGRRFVNALLLAGNQRPAPRPSIEQEWISAFTKKLPKPQVRVIADVRRAADRPLTDSDLWRLTQAASRKPNGERAERWAQTLEVILQDVFGTDLAYEVQPRESSGRFVLRIDGQDEVELDQVGAGVREAVAIAYSALSGDSADVLCIEEPENCLHPSAVRRLLHSLIRRAGVQLIVSTHSAAVINANPDSVVELRRGPAGTTSRSIDRASRRFEAIRSLGYSPADVVLAPCAVWVEGPSDRLYLAAWLSARGLTEGQHYQMMFFGGALGAHVTTSSDTEPGEQLAAIRTLGRRCAVIVDSDRSKSRTQPKPHVRRFQQEMDGDANAYLHVTNGREIENYVPAEVANAIRGQFGATPLPLAEPDYRITKVVDEELARRIPKVEFARRALDALNGEIPKGAMKFVSELEGFIRASQDR